MKISEGEFKERENDDVLSKGLELLEYYEKGPWPSHVTEIRKTK